MIKLVSIHIPKTGGSSFNEVLNSNYGEDHVQYFFREDLIEVKEKKVSISEKISPEIEVLHGHFHYKEMKSVIKKDNPKIITWLRDPVERVISNYHWWHYDINNNPAHGIEGRSIEPLEVYITRKETQNKMSRFLDGIKLEDLDFIGFLESFKEDLSSVSTQFNWKELPIAHKKNSKNFIKQKIEIGDDIRNKIKDLNKKDVKLYEKAQVLMGKKPKKKGFFSF